MIRIAIVGTGNISHAHVEAYLRFPERCKIVALVDIVPEKAQKMKEDYHLTEAEVYDDHQKILSRKDIDLVDVCTPPYVHASIFHQQPAFGQERRLRKADGGVAGRVRRDAPRPR